ncbi:MAG: CCA tRNA nucleotidyltransferase, partial [Myxococcales bacterium]|nr:CCA tRNA nucleotidyltransferase [Myxococcales bacterium]
MSRVGRQDGPPASSAWAEPDGARSGRAAGGSAQAGLPSVQDGYAPPPKDAKVTGVRRSEPPKTLREGADQVAEVLRAAGHQAYLAGGCVRDALLGVEPKDYDITTDATPEQVARLFRRTILVGAAFGVVKVVLGKDRDYEVATFRTDGTYTDGRRPDAVAYAKTAEEDVLRRDFTLNALLMDPRDDSILDFVGGRQDLEAGLIRAVGVPEARFQEDRLRMLRAVRFAARFGFAIEAETRAAIQHQAAALTDVSVERISAELEGIFKSERPGLGFELLAETGLLVPALPHLAGQAPEARARMQAALTRLPEAAQALGPDDRVIVAWALTL